MLSKSGQRKTPTLELTLILTLTPTTTPMSNPTRADTSMSTFTRRQREASHRRQLRTGSRGLTLPRGLSWAGQGWWRRDRAPGRGGCQRGPAAMCYNPVSQPHGSA